MKLLFILDTVEFPLAPTPALARRVAGLLAQRGHAVHLLELWDGRTPPPAAPGCKSHLLAFGDERRMNEALEFGRAGGTPVPLRLARLAAKPDAALAAVRQIALKRPRRLVAARSAIERLDAAEGFDAVVAVSGSSPAYVYMFIEAMADGAVRLGMPRKMAIQAAAQAVLGSAKMVLSTGEHPAALKDNVCSPGGTTIEAVQALEKNGFRAAVLEAMEACARKNRKMTTPSERRGKL